MAAVPDPRRRMVRRQIAGRGVADRRVLAAMEKVPREAFLPDAMQEFAYEDTPLPIGDGQTISQPWVVARMTELARSGRTLERVLEIGTGCGYQTAVLAPMVRFIYSIERISALLERARARFKELGIRNVHLRHGDGFQGWPAHGP